MESVLAVRDDQLGPAPDELTIGSVRGISKCLADPVVEACHLLHRGRRRGQDGEDFLPQSGLIGNAPIAEWSEDQDAGLQPEIAGSSLDAVNRCA